MIGKNELIDKIKSWMYNTRLTAILPDSLPEREKVYEQGWNDALNKIIKVVNATTSTRDKVVNELQDNNIKLLMSLSSVSPSLFWKADRVLEKGDTPFNEGYFTLGVDAEKNHIIFYIEKKYWSKFDVKEVKHITRKPLVKNDYDSLLTFISNL